jgi:hypothetical protein
MGKEKEFDNILDECLERVMKGEDILACLADHPEHAAELEPLLKTALDTRNAAAVKPRPEFRQRAGYEYQAVIREMPPQKAHNPFRWQVRWMAPVAIVIVLLLGGGGTVMAASNSLPDSPLYRVKLATETVQLAFTRSDLDKAELYARLADKRVEEIVKMAKKGNMEQVEKVTVRMDNQLIAMSNLTSKGGQGKAVTSSAVLQAPAAAPMPSTPSSETPSAGQAPPPTIEVPSAPITQTPAPGAFRAETQPEGVKHGNASKDKNATQKHNKQTKLKDKLVKNIEENLKVLQDELEKAPEALKPALQRAIEIARKGYEEAINNLEQDD